MPKRAILVTAAIAVSALFFSSCSTQSGLSLAREACGKVHSSITAYEAGLHTKDRATRERDVRVATDDLQAAEPLAASATSSDGQWNALMTTLNELGQVDEGHLISALRAQCAVTNNVNQEFPGGA